MTVVAIIQARMGSTRLPGKTMMQIEGKPLLWHVIFRVKKSKLLSKIVIATTGKEEDKVILKLAHKMGVESFAGSEKDVLDRYFQAAKKYSADIVVRVTADCPLIDPKIIDIAVKMFQDKDVDYLSNTVKRSFPQGVDVEVFKVRALERAWKEAKWASEREHVTPYIWKNGKIFKVEQFFSAKDYSSYRWTVDEARDLHLVREIFREFRKKDIFFMEDVLKLFERKSELKKINERVKRNEGYEKSLKEDKVVK